MQSLRAISLGIEDAVSHVRALLTKHATGYPICNICNNWSGCRVKELLLRASLFRDIIEFDIKAIRG